MTAFEATLVQLPLITCGFLLRRRRRESDLGADQAGFVTADRTRLANTSGTNTGDQDLSGLATTTALATEASTRATADTAGNYGTGSGNYPRAEGSGDPQHKSSGLAAETARAEAAEALLPARLTRVDGGTSNAQIRRPRKGRHRTMSCRKSRGCPTTGSGFDCSANLFPATGGSGLARAVAKELEVFGHGAPGGM